MCATDGKKYKKGGSKTREMCWYHSGLEIRSNTTMFAVQTRQRTEATRSIRRSMWILRWMSLPRPWGTDGEEGEWKQNKMREREGKVQDALPFWFQAFLQMRETTTFLLHPNRELYNFQWRPIYTTFFIHVEWASYLPPTSIAESRTGGRKREYMDEPACLTVQVWLCQRSCHVVCGWVLGAFSLLLQWKANLAHLQGEKQFPSHLDDRKWLLFLHDVLYLLERISQ